MARKECVPFPSVYLKCCFVNLQMKLDWCKQHGVVDVCRERYYTTGQIHTTVQTHTEKIHEETQRIGEATEKVLKLLKEMKQAISVVKEMKQRVRERKDNNINMTREVFATLRKAIDEREEQTIGDIKEEAYKREKALEVYNTHVFREKGNLST